MIEAGKVVRFKGILGRNIRYNDMKYHAPEKTRVMSGYALVTYVIQWEPGFYVFEVMSEDGEKFNLYGQNGYQKEKDKLVIKEIKNKIKAFNIRLRLSK